VDAFILGQAGGSEDVARPIAGASLLVRQIEWLRACGAARVIVNRVGRGASLDAASLSEEALGMQVVWIPSADPLDGPELARRVGARAGIVALVRHALLGDVDLRPFADHAARIGVNVTVQVGPLGVDLIHPGGPSRETTTIDGSGWMRIVRSEGDAQDLTEDLLMGRARGVEIRGSEVSKGVWTSRGAVVAEGARLVAPCYLGRDSFVAGGATAGPGAVLGERAVVEQGAVVTHARIEDGVFVGQGLVVSRSRAVNGRLVRHDGVEIDMADPLLVGSSPDLSIGARLAAALTKAALAVPASVAPGSASRVMRVLDRIARGSASWIGVPSDGDDEAALFDVEPALVPAGATEDMRTAARALYLAKKSPALDASLLVGLLMARSGEPS
jgi:hypothetical protein